MTTGSFVELVLLVRLNILLRLAIVFECLQQLSLHSSAECSLQTYLHEYPGDRIDIFITGFIKLYVQKMFIFRNELTFDKCPYHLLNHQQFLKYSLTSRLTEQMTIDKYQPESLVYVSNFSGQGFRSAK
jgi:hypothetical protein